MPVSGTTIVPKLNMSRLDENLVEVIRQGPLQTPVHMDYTPLWERNQSHGLLMSKHMLTMLQRSILSLWGRLHCHPARKLPKQPVIRMS